VHRFTYFRMSPKAGYYAPESGAKAVIAGTSAFANERTLAGPLFDHLVGAGEQDRRHVEAERLGGLEVEHELELGGCITGNSAGLAPLRIRPVRSPAWREASARLTP